MIFDNLTWAQLLVGSKCPEQQTRTRTFAPGPFTSGSKTETTSARAYHNFHVFNILPVTPLRTIDLGGTKISGPLFSRF